MTFVREEQKSVKERICQQAAVWQTSQLGFEWGVVQLTFPRGMGMKDKKVGETLCELSEDR